MITLYWGYVLSTFAVRTQKLTVVNCENRDFYRLDALFIVDARDSRRRTPLHYAASAGNIDAVVALLDAGADTAVQDVTGMTPLHLSVSETSHRVITVFCRVDLRCLLYVTCINSVHLCIE